MSVCTAECGCRCATCHPHDPALVADPRMVFPCGLCLRSMPGGLRRRFKETYRGRLVAPHQHAETVLAVLMWARRAQRAVDGRKP